VPVVQKNAAAVACHRV